MLKIAAEYRRRLYIRFFMTIYVGGALIGIFTNPIWQDVPVYIPALRLLWAAGLGAWMGVTIAWLVNRGWRTRFPYGPKKDRPLPT